MVAEQGLHSLPGELAVTVSARLFVLLVCSPCWRHNTDSLLGYDMVGLEEIHDFKK